ncbi:DUF2179 domain-containing protein [Staphylococcus chromogenes]|uniref:DUF2179 domain-containing protein n=1 Tax=Staphylococcus chromogenes TaxID=46126 RepID=UPI001CA58776|nr:DUF2179 domain-containing protein [Staphylococcus chromogenes]MBW6088572.1 DUF2179 domain-containing protein [Staphylococcus chromogenes]
MSVINDNPLLMVLAIFLINVAYVTALTMRLILTLKGYRYYACLLYTSDAADDRIEMCIRDRGYSVVNVTTADYELDIPRQLRDLGYGVTHFAAHGRDGDRLVMQILTPKRYELKLMDTIKALDPKAFIIAYEPRNIHGGFWVKGVRSKKVKAYDTDEI